MKKASRLECFPLTCPPPSQPGNKFNHAFIPRSKQLFKDVCEIINPRSILEVGSWMGASAIAWKTASEVYCAETTVYCVDTWLGSPEHYLSSAGNEWDATKLGITDMGPQFFDEFLHNVHSSGYQKYILPMRADSHSALKYIAREGGCFDVIYIDGAHDEISVFRDISLAFDLLAAGGVICGDDFGWQSVRTGLFLAKYDQKAPKSIVLVNKGDFIVLAINNHLAIRTFLDRGYSKWNGSIHLYKLIRFLVKKFFWASIKAF